MISIVSAYYGNEDMTESFLNNLQHQCKGQDVEMILVDAESAAIVHPFVNKFRYLTENISFANSMNTGIKEATGDYIVIIGNDGFPLSQSWLRDLQHILDTKPDVKIVTPVWDRPDFSAYHKLVLLDTPEYALMKMIPAVCWMLRKRDIERIGLFDERFKPGCYEDDDYCRRVRDLGGQIYVNKKVKLQHLLSQTTGRMDMKKMMKENEQRYKEKWGE